MPNELSEKVYPDGTVVKLRDDTARESIATINSSLLPIDAVVKRFNLSANRTLDTGINVNNTYSTGFIAIVSSHGSNNSGRMNIYMGGVAYRKQDGTVGDLNYSRLGGVGLGSGTAGDNLSFSISNDKLQIIAPQYQDTLSVTLILSKR